MSLAPGYRLVHVDPSRVGEVLDVAAWAFADHLKEEDRPEWNAMVPMSRTAAIEVEDESRGHVGSLTGVASSFTFTMRVPGGATVPVAGLTGVGVHTAHRRRGLLSALMTDHLEDARRRGEVASVLYAAETTIYQRFGYGLGAFQASVRLTRGAPLRAVPGAEDLRVTIEPADATTHGPVVASIQERLRRPGTMTLGDAEALRARFADPSVRHQDEPLRMVIVWGPSGDPLAYAMLRRRPVWTSEGEPDGVLATQELAALTPAAAHRLWTVLLDVDLMGSVEATPLALDDALLHLLEDPRAARARVRDNIWIRLVDVPAALAARTYQAPLDAVIQVVDPRLPANAGPWRLTTAGGEARIVPAQDQVPDLILGVSELGAAYLGGTSLNALAAAGRVEARDPAVLDAAAAAFGSSVAPVSNLMF